MSRLVSVLLLALFLAIPAQADEISRMVDAFRAEEPKLTRPVAIWRPALLIGELLEQASEQTGVQLYAEDSDGAASEIVLAYVKDLPLGELMEALASLLSEKGALWEWRKTTNSKGIRGYRLIRTRQAALAKERQRNRIREAFLRSIERALAGIVKNDPGAENLLQRPGKEREYVRANTTPQQRRAALFLETSADESDRIFRGWEQGALFPTLEITDGGFWDLNMCEPARALILQELVSRWTFASDQRGIQRSERVIGRSTDADALESIAHSTGLPVLARRTLARLPYKLEANATLGQLLTGWETGTGPFYLSKFRGKSLLVSQVAVDDDSADERLRLPWKFYKDLRVRLARERSLEDSLQTMSWMLSQVPPELSARFAQQNSHLVPIDLFASMEIVSQLITATGVFTSRSSVLLIASLGGQPHLLHQALTPEGLSYVQSPPQVQDALQLVGMRPYSVRLDTSKAVRWRMELHADPQATVRTDFGDRARQWRYRRTPARWSGDVTIFLQFEGREEIKIGTLLLHSPDLEFLPPPGSEDVPTSQR